MQVSGGKIVMRRVGASGLESEGDIVPSCLGVPGGKGRFVVGQVSGLRQYLDLTWVKSWGDKRVCTNKPRT